jgi:hypothetical protein
MRSYGIAILGLGLVGANTSTAGYGSAIKAAITGEKGADAHMAFLAVGGQIVFVLILAALAEVSPDFGAVVIALLLALWIVWAVGNANKITSAGKLLGVVQ